MPEKPTLAEKRLLRPKSEMLDWVALADDALEEARKLPHGAERSLALKKAGVYRNNADLLGIAFAPKGRPRK
jgi:hypothetical protein